MVFSYSRLARRLPVKFLGEFSMNLTVKFEGHIAEVIEKLIGKGVVATKTEALRLGVLELERKYLGSIGGTRKDEESHEHPQIVKKHDAAYR